MEFDFDDLKKIHEHRAYSYVKCVLYTLLTYGTYTFLMFLMSKMVNENASGIFFYILQSLLAIFFMNNIFMTFEAYDKPMREAYLQSHSAHKFNDKEERNFALHDPLFRTRMLTLGCAFLIVPVAGIGSQGLPFLIASLLHLPFPSTLACRMIGLAFFLPISFGWSIHAYVDVRKMWLEMPRRLARVRIFDSTDKKLKQRYGLGSMLFRIFGSAILYMVGFQIFPALVGAIAVFGAVAVMLAKIKWTWIILGVLVCGTYYLCIRTRFRFLRRLKKCCKKNGFELVAKKHPYRSLIRDGGGYNLVVKANGKTYYCRILASIKKSNKIYLRTDGTCERARLVRMPTVRLIRKGAFVQVNTMNLDEDREMFRIVSNFDYRFDAEGEKILLFNPVPTFLFRKAEDETSCPLDNGETVGEYKVFSGNGFLRALERDCA